MSIINNILSVSLIENKFDLTNIPKPNENGELSIGVGYSVKGIDENDDQVYQTNVYFIMMLGKDDLESDEILVNTSKKLINEKSYLYLKYRVSYDSRETIEELSDKNIDNILLIVEPFIREQISNMFSKSEMPIPPLPYRFWRDDKID